MALLTSLLGLFGAALALPGCARTPKTPAVPITEVQQISFSKQGMARTAITNRTIRRTDQGAEECGYGEVQRRALAAAAVEEDCRPYRDKPHIENLER